MEFCIIVITQIISMLQPAYNFKSIPIKIVANEELDKMVEIKYVNGIGRLKSVGTNFFNGLFDIPFLNLSLVFGKAGFCYNDKPCTGVMGMLERNEGDVLLLLGSLIDIGGLQNSYPVCELYQEIVTFPTKNDVNIGEIKNFTRLTWFLLISSLLCCIVIGYFRSNDKLNNIILYYLKFFINQQSSRKSYSLFDYFISIYSLFIICIFYCSLSSDLVTMDDHKLINTFEQLENSNLIPYIYKSSSLIAYIDTNETRFPRIKDRITKYNSVLDFKNVYDGTLNLIEVKKVALISDNVYNDICINAILLSNDKVKYYKSKERFMKRLEFFILSSNISLEKKNIFNLISLTLLESGIGMTKVERIKTKFRTCNDCQIFNGYDLIERDAKNIKFTNIRRFFIAPFICFAFSIAALIVEFCKSKKCFEQQLINY